MADMLLVGSKTKEALKANGCNVGGDALPALNMVVHWYVQQAAPIITPTNKRNKINQ